MKTEPYVEAAEGPDGEPILALVAGGAYQSATYLGKTSLRTGVCLPSRVRLHVPGRHRRARRAHAGGGRVLLPQALRDRAPRLPHGRGGGRSGRHVLAKERFFLQEVLDGLDDPDRLRLITAEGRAYLDSCPKTYDAIINDCFSGTRPARSS